MIPLFVLAHFAHHLLTALPVPLLPFIRDDFALDYTRAGLLISASVEPKNRGRTLGLHIIGGSASYFLAPLIAAAMTTIWGWRSPFIGLAIPTIVFGLIFYMLLGRRITTKKPENRITESYERTPRPQNHLRRLVSFIVLSAFTAAVTFSIASFIPLFMVDHFGVSKETAAVFLSLVYSAGLVSPLGGYLSDRLGMIPIMLTACFIAGPVVYLLNLVSYGVGIGAVLVAISVINYIRLPVSESYIVGQTSEHHRSMILGIYYFCSMEGSGILTPVIGYLIDHFGFYTTFTIAGAALVTIALACSIFLWSGRDH